MASPGPPPGIPPMDGTIGALSIGVFIACFLFGITPVQLYLYTQRFPKDRLLNKILVAWCWLFDALQTAFTCHVVYYLTVSHYADPSVLSHATVTLCSMSLIEGLIGGPVEMYFAYRVYKLSEGAILGKLVTVVIVITAIIHLALGVVFTSVAYVHPEVVYWETHLKWDSTVGLTCAAVSDVLIAVAMCYFLHARRTVFERSRGIVNKLMIYSIESGALTSVCAVSMVILFLTLDNLVPMGLLFFLPKLYTNSLLAMLNSRHAFRTDRTTVNGMQSQPIKFNTSTSTAADHIHLENQSNSWSARPLDTLSDKDHVLESTSHSGFSMSKPATTV